MSFRPLHDQVLVRQDAEAEIKSAGGIILPNAPKEPTQQGEVVAVGPKAFDISAGDRVMFGQYAGHNVTVDGQDCLIMREKDILGILPS